MNTTISLSKIAARPAFHSCAGKFYAVFFVCLIALAFPAFSLPQLEGLAIQPGSPDPVSLHAEHRLSPAGDTLILELTLKMLPGMYIYTSDSLFFRIRQTSVNGLGPSEIELPEPFSHRNFDSTFTDVFVDSQTMVIRRPIVSDEWALEGYIRYQACDHKMCFMPASKAFAVSSDSKATVTVAEKNEASGRPDGEWRDIVSEFEIIGSFSGYSEPGAFIKFLKNPESAGYGDFSDKNLLFVVILILLGGMALNLTPCVLPVIPITLAVIGAGSKAGSKARGFVVGAAYGLGMTFAYGMTGAAVVLTGVNFGVINSSPAFNIFIAAVFIVLALAMFDIIHIDFSRFRGRKPARNNTGTLAAAFGMGSLSALLAGACVAPVVISVILYSADLYAAGNGAGLLLPFLLGAGMALPWPFAGSGMSLLPKPGAWMVWVRNIFGVIILLIALYYGYTGAKMLAVLRLPESAIEQESSLPWHSSLREGLEKSFDDDSPVFIDFWATWCKNCLAMDATTFRDPDVEKMLQEFVLVKYQAENPGEPGTKEVLDYFGVIGLPTYVVLRPK